MEYGIQLYSLRDLSKEQDNLEGAVEAVAKMGYTCVEFAGFFGRTPKQINELLDRTGLTVSGTHTSRKELFDDVISETIAYHKEIGNKNIIIPGTDLTTAEKVKDFIEFLNYVQPKLKKEGIELGYHNHSVEFLPNEDGVISWYQLRDNTKISLEVDTYWAWNAGVEPIALITENAERIRMIHLKDGLLGGQGRSLGSGAAPVREVLAAARRLSMLPVVESEGLDPTGREEVQRCMDFLKSVEA